MIDCSGLSSRYEVRPLRESDVDAVLDLCRANPQFYRYCEGEPSREEVLRDMRVTPPGIGLKDKYYVGFYEDGELLAVLDLIDGYPEPGIAFIGFFMIDRQRQGRGIGSAIVSEAEACLKSLGKAAIRLGIDKGNPQSTHFWEKNGFRVIREAALGDRTVLVAEKRL